MFDGFVPKAWLKLPRETKEAFAADPVLFAAWQEKERRLCRAGVRNDPERGYLYWRKNYGVIQDKSGGDLHPYEPFEWQDRFAFICGTMDLIAFLKSRQAGGTTEITHYVAWEMGIAEDTIGTNHFASSNNRENAESFLTRVRTILISQPPWLRPTIGPEETNPVTGKEGTDNTKSFECPGRRTKLSSVAATARSVRSGAARTYTGDEAAFPPEGVKPEDWITAALPTIRGGGKAFFISTGNGDENSGSQGAAFARMWRTGQRGEQGISSFFVSREDDPMFKQEDFDRVAAISGISRAKQEYPLTPDEALAGNAEGKAYDSEHIAAALAKGRELDARREAGELGAPLDGEIWGGIDWGKNSSGVVIYPIRGHGFYICGEVIKTAAQNVSMDSFATSLLMRLKEFEAGPKWDRTARVSKIAYDSTGQGEIGFGEILEGVIEQYDPEIDIEPINFTKWKGKTVEFLRTLLRRTYEGQDFGWIAISPDACPQLVAELNALMTDEKGRIDKGRDHTHDSLIAGLAVAGNDFRDEYLS